MDSYIAKGKNSGYGSLNETGRTLDPERALQTTVFKQVPETVDPGRVGARHLIVGILDGVKGTRNDAESRIHRSQVPHLLRIRGFGVRAHRRSHLVAQWGSWVIHE
jgi:hypothetical protein